MVAKRKGAPLSSTSKKARIDTSNAEALVRDILDDPSGYAIPVDDQVAGTSAIKTPQQLEEAAEKIAKAARSGIKKQMTWKPSCKQGSAKFNYDGICPDHDVFGLLLGLDGPPTFKIKKIPAQRLEELIGDLRASARYSDLSVTSHVNVRWNPETGEFKFTGTYGV